jgi:putative spermidine/putrescine transport system substrate-binding protein
MSGYDSNLERRRFLQKLGWAVAVAPIGLSSACRKQTHATDTIEFTAPTSYDLDGSDWSELSRDVGLKVRFTDNGNDVGPVLARMLNGTMSRDFDVQGLQGGAEPELARAGVIDAWDLAKIPNWASVWPSAKTIPYTAIGNHRFGIPIALNADSIIYLPDEIKKVPAYQSGLVDSYASVFDPKLAGRTSMEDAWINSAIFTAIYLKALGEPIADPGDLSPTELRSVMTFLIDKKRAGQFRKFWQGWEQGVQLLKSGEVVAMTGWEPIVKALRSDGVNAEYAAPKEGYEGWTNTLILHRGAKTRGRVEAAHRFANWLLSGFYGCSLVKLRGYVVPCETTVPYASRSGRFDAKEVSAAVGHVKEKLGSKIFWQNVRPKEHRLYDEWWDKLRNA